MDKRFEREYHDVEREHFWFVARRDLLIRLLREAGIDKRARILEIGCSSGPLQQQLEADGYGDCFGIDISPVAIDACRRAGLRNCQVMDATALAFPPASFDVIIASDVLEHLDEDELALASWARALKPGGLLIVCVPAYGFLWSSHDVVNHHRRRYARRRLVQVVRGAGLQVERSTYWNSLLFVPAVVFRFARVSLGLDRVRPGGDVRLPPSPVNGLLTHLMMLENILCQRLDFPCGVSVFAIGTKAPAAVAATA